MAGARCGGRGQHSVEGVGFLLRKKEGFYEGFDLGLTPSGSNILRDTKQVERGRVTENSLGNIR